MSESMNLKLKLFLSTFKISAFTFGGGYVIVPLMKKVFVDQYKYIEENEMIDLIAIAQSSPGAIAINASIIIGYRLAGIAGSFITALGAVLPPFIIISVISFFYFALRSNTFVGYLMLGMQAGVSAVIIDVVLNLAYSVLKNKKVIYIALMAAAFIATFFFKVNIIFIILASGMVGAMYSYYTKKSGKE